jgi:branched-subunit amino acid transport protein
MTTWLIVGAAAVASYLLRISMLVAFADRPVPPALARRLPLLGPAALGALVAGALTGGMPAGAGPRVAGAPLGPVLAVVLALVVVRRTGRAGHALLVGLPVAALTAAAGW